MINSKSPESDLRSLLRKGLVAGRAGNWIEARNWFQAARHIDPNNTIALLWLAWMAPTRQESLTLLSRVLEQDPQNERARAGIRWARRRPATDPLQPDSSENAGWLDTDQPTTSLSPEETAPPRARQLVGPLGLLLLVATLLLAIGVVLIAGYSPDSVLALMLPTPTATSTPTPTFTATPTPTLTPTATFTPSPTPTPTPTATNTNTPTATSTPAPTPTATLPPPPPPTPIPPTSTPLPRVAPPATNSSNKWIDVDLTRQQVTAYEGNTPVYWATASTGLPNTPTVVGQFRIYWKLTASDMAGPGYYLPAVPYTMYFYRGYALHGTYWHNNFGQPMSHGCVNLRTEDAQWLFNWAGPVLPRGASHVRSSEANPGTLVVVHY